MSKGRRPSNRDKYIIRINNQLVEVTEAVYRTYHSFERRERYQKEQDRKYNVNLFSELKTDGSIPCDIPDICTDVESIAQFHLLVEALQQEFCKDEMALIWELYISGLRLCTVAKQLGIRHSSLQRKRDKLYPRLKRFLEIYYDFCGEEDAPTGFQSEEDLPNEHRKK